MADNHLGRRRKKYVHRWVYEMVYGPLKPGLVVRHKCDNRVCFRLSHLVKGTVADNNRDAQERGHLGQVRLIAPSEVRAIMARKNQGEIWTEIAKDYPQYSLATVKRAKDYLKDLP
ncbi:MAG TPA: HNH endonuclease signature motif containing protein [Nitrospiraceae bacterium]|nr:HNH endonuclease signature motif containing protein [Nitrospiraceae bacterium]